MQESEHLPISTKSEERIDNKYSLSVETFALIDSVSMWTSV